MEVEAHALFDELAHLRLAGVALLSPPAIEEAHLDVRESARRVPPQSVHHRVDDELHPCGGRPIHVVKGQCSPETKASEEWMAHRCSSTGQ